MTDNKYYIHPMGELKFASPLCTGSAPAIALLSVISVFNREI